MSDQQMDIYYIEGTLVFQNLAKPSDKYGRYDITIAVDDANLDVYNQSGMQGKPKYDDKYKQTTVAFGKPGEKKVGNIITPTEPPACLDAKQDNLDPIVVDRGSKVVCKVIVYDTPKGKGHRLSSVMVTDLVKKPEVHNGTKFAPF